MKILRDVAATLLAGIGMILFLAGGGLLMIAVLVSGSNDVEYNFMKSPVSPVEKRAEN